MNRIAAAILLSAIAAGPAIAQTMPAGPQVPATWTVAKAPTRTILFVGNSFTQGAHSAAVRYRVDAVTDLTGQSYGGVPAIFKTFTEEAGLDYAVSSETQGGKTLRFHYEERRPLIARPWDVVVLQELSTLDRASERPWSSLCVVVQGEWKPRIAGAPRDIDLLVRIGRTVFVGEVKIKHHPNSAAEIGRQLREFEKAADQLDLRVAFLRANSAELAKRTSYRQAPEQLKVFGFILSGTAFGSGLEIRGYPVIDTDALSFFFENDEFLTYATISRASGYRGIAAKPEWSIRLVDDTPEVCLAAFIRDPLHVRHAEIAIERTERGEQLNQSAERLRWVEHHIKDSLLGSETASGVALQLRELMRVGRRRARFELAMTPDLESQS